MGDGEASPTPPASALRASDAERERTATLLRHHAAAGRLTPEEFDERVEAAYAARTVGELDTLFHDLPAEVAVADPAAPPARTAAEEAARRRVLHVVGQSLLIAATAVAIWLATGAAASFWPKWVIVLSAIRVAFRAWAELGPAGRARRATGHEARLGRGGVPPREQPDERG